MNEFYPYHKVASDLAQDHKLENDDSERLESVIIQAILSGALKVYDQSGKERQAPVQFTKESPDVLVNPKEVNRWFLIKGYLFKWNPRKQRGRPPLLEKSIPKLKADGTLKRLVMNAVQELTRKNPSDINKSSVAKHLVNTAFQRRKVGVEYLKRHITKSMLE